MRDRKQHFREVFDPRPGAGPDASGPLPTRKSVPLVRAEGGDLNRGKNRNLGLSTTRGRFFLAQLRRPVAAKRHIQPHSFPPFLRARHIDREGVEHHLVGGDDGFTTAKFWKRPPH